MSRIGKKILAIPFYTNISKDAVRPRITDAVLFASAGLEVNIEPRTPGRRVASMRAYRHRYTRLSTANS